MSKGRAKPEGDPEAPRLFLGDQRSMRLKGGAH